LVIVSSLQRAEGSTEETGSSYTKIRILTGVRLAHRSGAKKARVAVARKLAVVLLTMWRSQMPFRWTTKLEAAPN
jgi:hypothetical protein